MDGVLLRVVQEWLRHSTNSMVMRNSHPSPGADAEFIKRLDGPSWSNRWVTEARSAAR